MFKSWEFFLRRIEAMQWSQYNGGNFKYLWNKLNAFLTFTFAYNDTKLYKPVFWLIMG